MSDLQPRERKQRLLFENSNPSIRISGFTLLELLIVIAVSSVLMSVAIPSYQHVSAQNHLATSTNRLLAAMVAARQTAVMRNASVTFCAGDPTAGCNGDWSANEWIVFVDLDRDGVIDAEDEVKMVERLDTTGTVQITGNGPFRNSIVFRSSGTAQWPSGAFAAGRLRLCAEKAFTPNAIDLVLIGSGRVVTERHDFSGDCPAL